MSSTPQNLSTADFLGQLGRLYPSLVGVRLNFVVDTHGDWATSTRNRSESEAMDLKLLNHLRSQSDLIVTGGKTALAENYQTSKWAPIAVFSRNSELFGHPMFTAPDAKHRNFLVTSDNESPIDDFRELQAQGFERILLESGPNLTEALATVIDEICVTVPNDSATPAFTALGIPRSTQLQHSLTVEGTTFMRFICT